MIFPQTTDRKYRVSHNEASGADLVETRNLDFSQDKYISTKEKPVVIYTNTDDSNFGDLLSVVGTETLYYFVTSDGIYSSTLIPIPSFAELTTSGRPTIRGNTDSVFFNGNMLVSGNNSIGYWNGSAWTDSGLSFSTSFPHPLCVYDTGNVLAVGNGNIVTTYNTSYALQNTLTIPSDYVVTWIRARSNNLYIGTRNVSGAGAKMFIWNGVSTGAQYFYGVAADWMYSGCEYDNSIAVFTSAGQLLYFNGGGFDELDNLPVYSSIYSWTSSNAIASANGKVANRGMIAKGKNLYINLDGSITKSSNTGFPGVYMPNQPSGVWEYTPTKGLSHIGGYPYTKYQTLTINEINTNALVLSAAHGCANGDAVYMNNATGLTGVSDQQTYYASNVGTTSLQLALTPADAANGKYLAVTGTPSGASVCVETLDSVGATFIRNPGAIALINTLIPNNFFGSTLLFGGSTLNGAGVLAHMLMSFGLGRNRGYLVTAPVDDSRYLTEDFKNLFVNILQLSQSVDSLHIKYKIGQSIEYPTMVSVITWVSSTVFTITETNQVDFASVVVGDEVSIVQGAGAGYAAHITNIAQSGQTYTVTLDEAIPLIVNGNASSIVVENWKALDPILSTAPFLNEGYGQTALPQQGSWTKLKIEFRGIYLTIGRLVISVAGKKPII